eukprot:sb/3477368/
MFQLSQNCSTEKSVRFGLKWMLASCSASKKCRGTKFWCLYLVYCYFWVCAVPRLIFDAEHDASISIQNEQIFRHQNFVPRLFFDAEHDASIHFNPKRIYFSVEQFCES